MKKKIKYILKKQLYKKHFLLFVFSSIFNKPYIFFLNYMKMITK